MHHSASETSIHAWLPEGHELDRLFTAQTEGPLQLEAHAHVGVADLVQV